MRARTIRCLAAAWLALSVSCSMGREPAACGNGQLDDNEACDDGNQVNTDECTSSCAAAACGDGIVRVGVEECDDGNLHSDDGCRSNCTLSPTTCGDGSVDAGEDCDDGNLVPGDGCENDCTRTPGGPMITTCAELAPLPSGTCAVTAGGASKLIVGTILTPGEVLRGGQVLVDGEGRIACVGCDCSASSAGATRIECPRGVVSPGLINSHDHITFAHNDPYTDTGERFEQRHDWRKGQRGHQKITASGGATVDQIRWGELRFLMGGATSTVGSGGADGLLRNLDTSDQEGLGQDQVEYETFPLGDSNGLQLESGCGYPKVPTAESIASEAAYFPHVSEGIDAVARNEFLCLSSEAGGGHDVVLPQSAFTHAIGLTAPDYAQMAADGTTLIWSARSNITLYGDTAVVTEAARLGVLITLGTDWVSTGSMNLLRELACADTLNRDYYGGFFTDEELWMMATYNAALASATDDVIGVLATGRVADIAVFDGSARADHRAILEGEPKDVALVLRGGKPLYGDDAVVAALSTETCDALDVCGAAKRTCVQGDTGKSLSQLQASAAGIYPAFFCGAPDDEPACLPRRPASVNGSTVYTGELTATDADGDGIADSTDNCPAIFNPVRPVDDGAQADFDADGVGDACDPCPLDADTVTCTVVDPNDSDRDGVPNSDDNCPALTNADQADGDTDGKGDACDACPAVANPGAAACPGTIYEVKTGVIPTGATVALARVLVTGRATSGFFVQVKEGDAAYAGADNSGIYVHAPGHAVQAGNRVSLTTAQVTNFYGQIQLSRATVVVDDATVEASPAPVVAEEAEVATGGARAAALEGVLVRVLDATVTDVAPAPGAGDSAPTNEFVVSGTLRVNDLLFLPSPLPAMGTNFASITGVLDYRNGNSKLEPRGASDLAAGAVSLVGLAPASSFVREAQSGVSTLGAPLAITLSHASDEPTFVAIASSDAVRVSAVGGGVTVAAGTTSAVVLLDTGAAQAEPVVLTATLGAVSFDASVRVLAAAEPASLAGLSPATATIAPGGSVNFTVTLDIPAPPGGAVVNLAVTPATAGTIPPSVTVPADQQTATFDYVDAMLFPEATVSATLGALSMSAQITVAGTAGHLVINEVDYDQPMTDSQEFIEIYNPTGATISLANLALVMINGADNAEYRRIDLAAAGTLGAGQYLLLSSPTVPVPLGTQVITAGFPASNAIQNGAPDAIAIVDLATGQLVDALAYEGEVRAGVVADVGARDFVEGTPLSASVADSNDAAGSLARRPNGADTDDAATDWAFTAVPTPGAANAAP